MAIPAFDSVPDAVANSNFKVYGDSSSAIALLQSQNAAAHANRVNTMAEGTLAAWANRMVSPDIIEAVSAQKLLSGRESQGIAEAIALAQVLMKGAQTTPPPTH